MALVSALGMERALQSPSQFLQSSVSSTKQTGLPRSLPLHRHFGSSLQRSEHRLRGSFSRRSDGRRSEQQAVRGPSPSTSAALLEHPTEESATNIFGQAAKAAAAASLAIALSVCMLAPPAEARLEGVNKPELLPQGPVTPVIDVAGFLTSGQIKRLSNDVERLEKDTGFKLRILAQNYPKTPGLAIRDYWGVDDSTVVFVADPSLGGNILNFNVGATVDLYVPRSFWSRLSGKYGTIFYWKENGEEAAIEAAVMAIDACLREPVGPLQCGSVL